MANYDDLEFTTKNSLATTQNKLKQLIKAKNKSGHMLHEQDFKSYQLSDMIAAMDETKLSKSPKIFFAERNANQMQTDQRFAIPMKQSNKKKNTQKGKIKSNVEVNNKLDRR